MIEKRNYKLYVHINKYNKKKYIGITRQKVHKRWRYQGKGYKGCPYFWKAIEKYGWDNFYHNVIFENLTETEACVMEKTLIKVFRSNEKEFGYNIDKGGSCVKSFSLKVIQKISKTHKGKVVSEETKKKISQHHADVSGKNNPMYGTHSWCFDKGRPVICLDDGKLYKNVREVVKETEIPESGLREVLSKQHKATRGKHFVYADEYDKDKWYNMEVGNNKCIVCTDTGEFFLSIKECSEKMNLDSSSITKNCKGKKKSVKGFHFQYWKGQNIERTKREDYNKTRKIKCLNNGKCYNKIQDAAKELSLDSSSITKNCKGKKKSVKGYKFVYI